MRFGHCLGAVVGMMLWVSAALGQSFGFDPSANNPTPEMPAIRRYINDQVSILAGPDRNAVVTAREALLAPIAGSASPSAAFLEMYVNELAGRIGRAVTSNDSHVRINTAIVIERVCALTGTTKFAPQIATLIGDNSPAITIWGLRAATPIIPDLVGDSNAPAVFGNIQASITIHSDSAAVVEEAYNTLTTSLKNTQSINRLGNRKASVLNAIVYEVQSLLETRLTNDPAIPRPGPLLDERGGLRFLFSTEVWPHLNSGQKARSAQLMAELLNRSLTRVMAGRNPNATPEEKALGQEHNELIRRSGRLLQVLADIIKDSVLSKQASEVSRLNPAVADDVYSATINSAGQLLGSLFPRPATQPAQ